MWNVSGSQVARHVELTGPSGYYLATPEVEYLPPLPNVDSVRDIVLIFDEAYREVEEFFSKVRIRHPLGFLTNLFEAAIPHLDRVRYTLVGMVRLPYGSLGQKKTKRSKIRRKFYRRLRQMLCERYPDSDDEVNTRLAAVTLVTHEDYLDQLGEDRFDWEIEFEDAWPDE